MAFWRKYFWNKVWLQTLHCSYALLKLMFRVCPNNAHSVHKMCRSIKTECKLQKQAVDTHGFSGVKTEKVVSRRAIKCED